MNALRGKNEAIYKDSVKKRALDFQSLTQKYDNKINDFKHEQKNFELWQKNPTRTKLMMNVPGSTKSASKLIHNFFRK